MESLPDAGAARVDIALNMCWDRSRRFVEHRAAGPELYNGSELVRSRNPEEGREWWPLGQFPGSIGGDESRAKGSDDLGVFLELDKFPLRGFIPGADMSVLIEFLNTEPFP